MKGKHLQLLVILLAVLVTGYAPRLIGMYYQTVIGDQVAITVPEASPECPSDKPYCYKDYDFDLPEGFASKSLVLGIVFSASEWSCGEKKIYTTGDVEKMALSRLTYNEYFVIDSPALRLCERGHLSGRVYFSKSQKKSGLIASELILTSNMNASKIKSAQEFVYKDYKVLNLCTMLFLLIFSFFMQIVSLDVYSGIRFKLSGLLMVGAVAQSGILEVFLPFEWTTNLNRWAGMLAYCSYLMYSSRYLSANKSSRTAQMLLLGILVAALAISQDRVTSWIWYSFAASAVALVMSVIEKNPLLAILGALTLTTSMEFVGVQGVPNSYIVPTFLALLVFLENSKAFGSFLKINKLLRLSSKRKQKATGNATDSIIKLFQRLFRIDHVTVLNIADQEIIHLQQYTLSKMKPTSLELKELPPIFAHVVTTGNELVNVHVNSKLVEDLRRGDSKHKIDSDHFTALPLMAGKQIIGVLALTKYGPEQFKTPLSHATFMFCLDILKGLLVEHLLTTPKTQSLHKISLLSAMAKDFQMDSFASSKDVVTEFAGMLSRLFGWRIAAFGEMKSDYQLEFLECYNFDAGIGARFRAGKIYAHKDNLQGPLAIAVHSKKEVIVPNTKWLEGVVHQNTTEFFAIHKTTTAAFVPVLGFNDEVVGVFWIEGISGNEISYADRELFNYLIKEMSSKIRLLAVDQKLRLSTEGLAGFIPEHLVQDYLGGAKVVEKDTGFLMMFDLKGSTRLSHALGNDTFHKEMEKFKEAIVEVTKNEWVLRQFVWDGFDFTRSSSEGEEEVLDVLDWSDVLEASFMSWKNELLKNYGSMQEIVSLSFRVCFTFGDISRGVVEEGSTKKWTLIGNAVAVASKVEQASKDLSGTIFCDETMLSRSVVKWIELKKTQQGLVVFGLSHKESGKKAA